MQIAFSRQFRRVVLLACVLQSGIAGAASTPRLIGESRDFWVKKSNSFRLAHATLRAAGARSYIYVEENLPAVSPAYVQTLEDSLEEKAPDGAFYHSVGIVPLLEQFFGPLPNYINPDDRLIVLFADLGQSPLARKSYFNPFDRLTAEQGLASKKKTNEANIIYLNGVKEPGAEIPGLIARELTALLTYQPTKYQDSWLQETLSSTAVLGTGTYVAPAYLKDFAAHSGNYSLATSIAVQRGPQLLFASFMLDSLVNAPASVLALSRYSGSGRVGVEKVFREGGGGPVTFDVLFSGFLSYIFENEGNTLPLGHDLLGKNGLKVPAIAPYAKMDSFPSEIAGALMPYSVVAIDLPEALSSTAQIQVLPERQNSVENSCARQATVLWKPIHLKRIAIYAVGCEPVSPTDLVQFRLRIVDKPFLLPASPFKIAP